MDSFPSLDGFGPTRATLHTYALAINALARAHAPQRPNWWHTSLKLFATGLASDPLPLPAGGAAVLRMNFATGQIEFDADTGTARAFPMDAGWTGTQMGDVLIAAAAELGLQGTTQRQRFASDAPGVYDAAVAGRFFQALQSAARVFAKHMATVSGMVSEIQLWPHNFDLSVEWYGSRLIPYEADDTETLLPSQLNLGFYPGAADADSYLYSNPWPFETEQLVGQPLPGTAVWHTDGWMGTMLPYAALVHNPDAEQLVFDFAQKVYAIAAPTLTN